MPPVRYSFLPTTFSQMASIACTYAASPVSAATSAMPEYMYVARTAWPDRLGLIDDRSVRLVVVEPARVRLALRPCGPRSSSMNFASVEILLVRR